MGFFGSLLSTFNQGIDIIMRPLVNNLSPFWALVVFCIGLTFLITLAYKYTTNQSLMKDLKEELNAISAQVRALKHDPEKAMEVQKKAMDINLKYMSHSMRSTLYTIIPIFLLFAWLNATLAFVPIPPGQEFTTTVQFAQGAGGEIILEAPQDITVLSDTNLTITDAKATWKLKAAKEGTYYIDYRYNDQIFSKEVIISSQQRYATPQEKPNIDAIVSVSIDHQPLKFNIAGLRLSWFWIYFIVSIVSSMIFRKAFGVY